jgi:hypothetical protein
MPRSGSFLFLADTNADGLTASVVVDVESLPKAAALAPPYAVPGAGRRCVRPAFELLGVSHRHGFA